MPSTPERPSTTSVSRSAARRRRASSPPTRRPGRRPTAVLGPRRRTASPGAGRGRPGCRRILAPGLFHAGSDGRSSQAPWAAAPPAHVTMSAMVAASAALPAWTFLPGSPGPEDDCIRRRGLRVDPLGAVLEYPRGRSPIRDPADIHLPAEERIFRAVNVDGGPWVDAVARALSSPAFGGSVAVLLAAGLLLRRRGERWGWVLALAAALALTDGLGSQVVRPLLPRARPAYALPGETVRFIAPAANVGSIPSLHAANFFAMAAVARRGCQPSGRSSTCSPWRSPGAGSTSGPTGPGTSSSVRPGERCGAGRASRCCGGSWRAGCARPPLSEGGARRFRWRAPPRRAAPPPPRTSGPGRDASTRPPGRAGGPRRRGATRGPGSRSRAGG